MLHCVVVYIPGKDPVFMIKTTSNALLLSLMTLASAPVQTIAQPQATTPAPIPSTIGDRATLEIQGAPGEGQSLNFYYMSCKRDSSGAFVVGGCGSLQKASLNQKLEVRA